MRCLEAGAIEMLMVWENLDTWRLELRNPVTGDEETLTLR
jgi:peptide subunit release factor 1 (eRF1)